MPEMSFDLLVRKQIARLEQVPDSRQYSTPHHSREPSARVRVFDAHEDVGRFRGMEVIAVNSNGVISSAVGQTTSYVDDCNASLMMFPASPPARIYPAPTCLPLF